MPEAQTASEHLNAEFTNKKGNGKLCTHSKQQLTMRGLNLKVTIPRKKPPKNGNVEK